MVRLRVADFNLAGRATYGTIVMRLNENDKIAFAALVDELSEEEIKANKQKELEEEEFAEREAEFKANLEAANAAEQENEEADEEEPEPTQE